MPRKSEFPRTIKQGSATVKIYRVSHKTTATGLAYILAWNSGGRRLLKQFASEAEANEEARLKVAHLAAGRVEAAEMGRDDRDTLLAAKEICDTVPILAALEEWKKARDLTDGHLIQAAEAWTARNGTSFEIITVAAAVEKFTRAKERAGVDIASSYNKILPSLTKQFNDRSLSVLSSRELSAWLESRYPHPVSRNTARKRIVTLWRWARKQGYLPREALTEAEQTESARETHSEIGVISGSTFTKLLHRFLKKELEYLAPLVLSGFCGMRRSEVHAQAWEDVNLERAFVRVTKAKRNTPARRLIPLCPAAIAWLKLCPGREGPLCVDMAVDRIRAIGREINLELPDNCFRHSFISHRVAQTGNVAETALEAGNSPQVIFQHYRELFSKEDGKAWFEIQPAA